MVLRAAVGWRRQKAGWGWLDSGVRLEQDLRECAGKGGSMTHEMLIAWKKWCLREEKRTGKMKIVKMASQRFINALLPSHMCWNMYFQPSQAYWIGLDRPTRV